MFCSQLESEHPAKNAVDLVWFHPDGVNNSPTARNPASNRSSTAKLNAHRSHASYLGTNRFGPVVRAFIYQNDQEEVVGLVTRHGGADRVDGKTFRPWHPVHAPEQKSEDLDAHLPPGHHWELGDPEGGFPLYRLPEVRAAISNGEPVYFTEGERDADAIREQELVATTNAHGADGWKTNKGRSAYPVDSSVHSI